MQAEVKHLTMADLEAGLDEILKSPKDQGVLDLIVSRPQEDAREVMSLADLDVAVGPATLRRLLSPGKWSRNGHELFET